MSARMLPSSGCNLHLNSIELFCRRPTCQTACQYHISLGALGHIPNSPPPMPANSMQIQHGQRS
jgi:hypothetical protein